jgi:hypothetical protein
MNKMAKKAPKKQGIEKASFDLDAFKENEGLDNVVKDKNLAWIPLSEAFHDAVKVPGIPIGYFTSFRGYSNTGKSTAIYEGIVGCQKLGILPIIFETEGNWNWEHARNIGVEYQEVVDEETGEIKNYKGDFIFMQGPDLLKRYQNYDHQHSKMGTKPLRYEPVVEDISTYMNYIMDKQQDGSLPRSVAFFWDSVGSINCFKGATSKTTNNQWTAGALATCFKSLINYRIPASRREDCEHTATFAVVQQIWLDNENKVIKHKGGEAFFYSPRMIFHFGGILTHSTEKLKATHSGEEFQFGVTTRIRCEKNQVNGIEQKGMISSTPHGYWNPDKINEYKDEHKQFIKDKLNTDYDDFLIETEAISLGREDMTA